jgi:class 3 adenylate cyclase/predicted ATPase
MQQIADWLKSLELLEYAERFAENGIDISVLPHLTDQDLRDMGVLLGHRRKMLAAIGESSSKRTPPAPAPATSTPVVPAPMQTADATARPGAPAAGERRYLTVLFCDLVGSTGISAQLDAEEWRDLVAAYLDTAAAAVAEMGGHVAKKLGDGLLALFGYPVAQENDAERAARAALSIHHALAELNRKNAGTGKPELAARIGLDTGPAVVDAAGEIYGDVANVAARVEALAEPGAVLITARVQRQVAGLFVAEEGGSHTLKGIPEPTLLFRLVRASGGGRHSGPRQLTPLVGRDDEIAMLMRRWERARQGDGQLVMIVGEPGLGKSRLIEEFHSRLSGTPHTWVEWSCSQLLQNTPLHPIAEWGRQRFGGADVPAERRLADLESSLAQGKLDPQENAALLAPLLDIPLPKERIPALASDELRRRQLAALTNWVIAGARVQPVVLALEDLHWADPTTLDVLRGIAERGALAPLYVVTTTRPEFRPPWGMRSHHATISLAPLDRQQVREMVSELSARHALANEVVEDVAARTGGVPLFIEEVTRLLLERGEQGGIQTIPPTLQQSLMARLDRLGPAREVAQIGSVIGRGFSYSLLRDVAGIEDAALQAALEKLAEADIVLVQGLPPESDYRFKHALIQDAAYENLLKSRRQALHRRVAETLRDRFAETAGAEPEALAHHFTQAAMTDDAIEWWGKAGDQALRRSAFQEAISHLGKAIEMADKAEGGTPREITAATAVSERLKLQTNYGRALAWSRGFAAEETKAAYARAHELSAADTNSSDERFDSLYGQWVTNVMGGELGIAHEIAEIFWRSADNSGRMTETIVGLRYLGFTCNLQGELREAEANLLRALELYNPERDREANLRYGVDTRAGALSYLACTKWGLGEIAQARGLSEEAIAHALGTGHVPTIAAVYLTKAVLESMYGDAAATRRTAETVLELGRQHMLAVYVAWGQIYSGWAREKLGESEAGTAQLQRGLIAFTELGNKGGAVYPQGLLAEIEAHGQVERALARIDEALALAQQTGEHWSDGFLHRIRGEILLKRDPANATPAEEAFLTAIAIARRQKAKSFELRAALAMAKLYQSTGRAADAQAVLTPALQDFPLTPEFPEVAEAQSLLAALAETDELKGAAVARERRAKLHTAYGLAVAWSRGFASEETKAAFTRASELSADVGNLDERFTTLYGRWVSSLMRSELDLARKTAETFLREAENAGRIPETLAALRYLGLTLYNQGRFVEARTHLEKVLETYDPGRDSEAAFRFGTDTLASATIYLATVYWHLGDLSRARELTDAAVKRAVATAHDATLANTWLFKAIFEIGTGNAKAVLQAAQLVVEISERRSLPNYLALGHFYRGWARTRLGDTETGIPEIRQGLAAYIGLANKSGTPLLQGFLAEIEAGIGSAENALIRIDDARVLANETGQHGSDVFLLRIRGEILLRLDPARTNSAEESFLAAVGIAQQQEVRTDQLLAALALAKLYRTTARAIEAYAVLAPALVGFSRTPELLQVEEAQELLAALAEADEVKGAVEARERRIKLQTAYSLAVAWSRGFASDETKAAFARAQELSAGTENLDERFTSLYGQWITSFSRAELGFAGQTAETFLREAENAARAPEKVAAIRYLGVTRLTQGHFLEARTHLEEVLRTYDPSRDRDASFRFGTDALASATIYLAQVLWQLGEFKRARDLSEEAVVRAVDAAHDPTLANVWLFRAAFEMARDDAEGTLRAARALHELSDRLKLPLYSSSACVYSCLARVRLGDSETSFAELRNYLADLKMLTKIGLPFLLGKIAEIEGELDDAEVALVHIDEALVLVSDTGEHQHGASLHRIRGKILLKLQPAKTEIAEDAFLTAISIAQQQGNKTSQFQAALVLAKLYQATSRATDARAVLAPALEGFTPTLELPEIEEARALSETLSAAITPQ